MEDTSKKVFTIPNIITFLRILVIPFFVLAYVRNHLITALILVILSALSDTLDGTIARATNSISDMGKWLDPLADKLSQMTIAILMFIKFYGSTDLWMRRFAWVFLLFVGKEVLILLVALVMFLVGLRPQAAEIWGKAATVVFYTAMAILFLAGPDVGVLANSSNIYWVLPEFIVKSLVILSVIAAFISLFAYIPGTYRKFFQEKKEKEAAEAAAKDD